MKAFKLSLLVTRLRKTHYIKIMKQIRQHKNNNLVVVQILLGVWGSIIEQATLENAYVFVCAHETVAVESPTDSFAFTVDKANF